MNDLDIAKEKFYRFFVGVAGLRFSSREQFDEVVEAIVRAAQKTMNDEIVEFVNDAYMHDEDREKILRFLRKK